MSLSICYQAKRKQPLSEREKSIIQSLIIKYTTKRDILLLVEEGAGEVFSLSCQSSHSDLLLKGAVKLPLKLGKERIDDFMYVAETWIDLLSDIRNQLGDAEWSVMLDDENLRWNEQEKKFDLPLGV